jgi:hypothetical protein
MYLFEKEKASRKDAKAHSAPLPMKHKEAERGRDRKESLQKVKII